MTSSKAADKRKRLLSALRKQLRKANAEETDDEMSDKEIPHASKKSKSMLGNKYANKPNRIIEIGWIHDGQQVRMPTGGGTRKTTISKDGTASAISEEATKLFFPDGESKKGIKLDDVDLEVCDFSMRTCNPAQTVGEAYEIEKPSGVMRYYLSSTTKSECNTKSLDGRQSSSSLRVKQKDSPGLRTSSKKKTLKKNLSTSHSNAKQEARPFVETEAPSTGLYPVIKGKICLSREPLQVQYFKEIESSCQEVTCMLSANSRKECMPIELDVDVSGASVLSDPLENGYVVSGVSKNGVCFVRRIEIGSDNVVSYELPAKDKAESSDPNLILHQPNEVWGYEEGKLVLGVISPNHNHEGLAFEWFCDEKSIYSAGCILVVDKPGNYYCQVKAFTEELDGSNSKEISRASNSVQVVEVTIPPARTSNIEVSHWPRHEESGLPQQLEMTDLSIDFKEPINHGSFGEVFKGKYMSTVVAVKKIKSKQGKRPDKLIVKEALIHQQIAHSNIVDFIGTSLADSHVFIVTEFIDGQNMEDVIYAPKISVDKKNKVSIAVDVLKGVKYLHEHIPQIIHQDIKPANIMIDKVYVSAKLCDLGLAKIRSFDVASTTSGVHTVGTPEYMPPETLVGGEKANTCTDMWSVGITLMEWFSGTDAWDLQNQEDEPLVYIRRCMQKLEVPQVLHKYKLILLRPCARYNPADRPTARQLLRLFQCPSCSKEFL